MKDLFVSDEESLKQLFTRVRRAQEVFAGFSQERVDEIFFRAAMAANRERVRLANEYSGGGQHTSVDSVCPAILTNPKQKLITCKHYLMNPQFNSAGSSVDKPCFTLIARMDKMPPYLVATETGQISIEIYGTDSPMTRKIKEFMALYGIMDVKMRMLRIPELKRIMGFPEDYVLVGTQADQKKFIGNAVEVNMARMLCEAICAKLRELRLKNLNKVA